MLRTTRSHWQWYSCERKSKKITYLLSYKGKYKTDQINCKTLRKMIIIALVCWHGYSIFSSYKIRWKLKWKHTGKWWNGDGVTLRKIPAIQPSKPSHSLPMHMHPPHICINIYDLHKSAYYLHLAMSLYINCSWDLEWSGSVNIFKCQRVQVSTAISQVVYWLNSNNIYCTVWIRQVLSSKVKY